MRVANHSMSIFIHDDGLEQQHEDQHDRRPLEGPAEQEDDDHDDGQHRHRRNLPASSALVATVAVPSRENTAPKTLDATARNRTVLDWSRVL